MALAGRGASLLFRRCTSPSLTSLSWVAPRCFMAAPPLLLRFASITEGAQMKERKPKWFWDEEANRRAFMDSVAATCGVKEAKDWAAVRHKQVLEMGGGPLLQRYCNSLSEALQDIYPEIDMAAALKGGNGRHHRRGHWASRRNRTAFLQEAMEKLNIQKSSDWQKVTNKDIIGLGGRGLLARCSNSLHQAILSTDLELDESWSLADVSSRVPKGYWEDLEKRRTFLTEFAEAEGIVTDEDWRTVTKKTLTDAGGRSLLRQYSGSILYMLQATFPERFACFTPEEWDKRRPKDYWSSQENRRQFMDTVALEHGVSSPEDWRQVTSAIVRSMGGGSLLARFNNSLFQVLADAYPELDLKETTCRERVPKAYWLSQENRRAFLDRVADDMGVTTQEDWRNVTPAAIKEMGGSGLLQVYANSMYALLSATYPEKQWSKFLCRPVVDQDYWKSEENIKSFVEHVKEHLKVTDSKEWFRVSLDQLRTVSGGRSFLRSGIPWQDALRLAYPDEDWTVSGSMRVLKKSAQRHMRLQVSGLFPGCAVEEDILHKAMEGARGSSQRGRALELDVYVPDLRLAFEYNGEHHYEEVPIFAAVEEIMERDREKRALCVKHGIRLVEVPHWWDNSIESLAATVEQKFPGLLASSLTDCPENMAEEKEAVAALVAAIEAGVYQPIPEQASRLSRRQSERMQLAKMWRPGMDVSGMLMSEKYDGSRVYWDGDGTLGTRYGKRVDAPQWWLEQLPAGVEVDGELWMGRGSFRQLASLIGQKYDSRKKSLWKKTALMAFDSPAENSGSFEDRLAALTELDVNENFQVVPHRVCSGEEELEAELERVLGEGGEGLILRDPSAPYSYGRSPAMLKVKKVEESEVRMVQKSETKRGLIVQVPSTGLRQTISCSAQQYEADVPKAGQVLTVTHSGAWARTGRLKAARFLRVREDMAWEDVLKEARDLDS